MTQIAYIIITNIADKFEFGSRDVLRRALDKVGISFKDFEQYDGTFQRAWAVAEIEAKLPALRDAYEQAKKPRGTVPEGRSKGSTVCSDQWKTKVERALDALLAHAGINVGGI